MVAFLWEPGAEGSEPFLYGSKFQAQICLEAKAWHFRAENQKLSLMPWKPKNNSSLLLFLPQQKASSVALKDSILSNHPAAGKSEW